MTTHDNHQNPPPFHGSRLHGPAFLCNQPGNRYFDKNLMLEPATADGMASETVMLVCLNIYRAGTGDWLLGAAIVTDCRPVSDCGLFTP